MYGVMVWQAIRALIAGAVASWMPPAVAIGTMAARLYRSHAPASAGPPPVRPRRADGPLTPLPHGTAP
jgi:hypothetical protein